ncbi:SURF1 family protein [Pseudochrobactrum saccharolyticum]|uniref:SURF1 family protein n=1 Tax=Pseudochrobactrum saccharolyticum TaxID=354352 RepID=UPI00277A858C|nr:SURF1 family protein [Pseudochrobactrum saccharolyticum]MDP8250749.1 SURF1 family protein [Pseudochrobactrum saccharolyticum]
MAENQTHSSGSKRTKIVLISLIAGLLITGLSALGLWQVKRLSWKHDLIARVEQNINANPVSAPDINAWQNADKKAYEYRAVTLSGHYLNNKEIAVGALTERGSGYWIVTPFLRDNGETVFINRGYVASARRDPLNRTSGQIEGETTVTGLLRLTEPKGFFLRQNEPEKNIWYARDIEVFAKHADVKNVPDYFIDANGAQNRADRPEGGLTVVKFADNHLVYALTWFSLALMVFGMAVFLIRYEGKPKSEDDD